MERQMVISALKATTSPGDQSEATTYLNNCSAMIGFSTILMDILREEHQEMAVRQAAVIFFKNLVNRAWNVDELDKDKITQISEQDKVAVRSVIVDLIVEAPDSIRVQLCVSIQAMLRHDFPDKWATQNGESIVVVITRLLSSNQGEKYLAGLYVTYRLAKIFEYKRQTDKGPFILAMQQILPILYNLFKQLLPLPNQESCLLQKLILKIFYCLVQFSLSPDIFTTESFQGWFEIFITVMNRDIPSEVDQYDNDEKEATVYWKCKNYGSKGHVEKAYEQFAEYYTNHLASHAITSVMHILSQHAAKTYVSDRVLHLCISHLAEALSHAQIWKVIKDHLMGLFTAVLFPLMKHTEEDEELWTEEPEVYLREKMDCWEELHSPSSAAVKFINAATKRKGVLQPILEFVIHKLDDQTTDPRDVDGALHVISSLAEFLCNDRRYKKDVEKLLYVHVRPRISSNVRYVRARALHVINEAAGAPIKSREFLNELTELITQRLQDPNEELPVKFEASLAIQSLISNQEEIHQFIRPRIRELLTETLRLLRQVQLEDLPAVVESLVENFEDDVIPVAESIVAELIHVFNHLTATDNEEDMSDENGITINGCFVDLCRLFYRPDIVTRVEPLVHGLVMRILDAFASDYFDECTGLIETLIIKKVSPQMWEVFDKLCEMQCPASIDTLLLTQTPSWQIQNVPRKLLHMCSHVMNDKDCGDDIRAGAVKILEYMGDIILLLMQFFAQASEGFEEFESQLVVTLLSAFVCNPQQFLNTLVNLEPHRERNFAWLFDRIFNGYKSLNGIHDCAMILHACIMGIRLPAENRPPKLNSPQETLTIFMELFDNIKRCRIAIANNEKESDDDSDSSDNDDATDKRNITLDLNDSDDDLNEADREYMSHLNRLDNESDSDDSEARHSFVERTDLEDYETLFDGEDARVNVYDQFMNLLDDLAQSEPHYYQSLIHFVPEEKKPEFEELIATCRREREHFRSKQVHQQGGYDFSNMQVPNQFNFA
ncbi:D-Importin 7/RanBP7 [Aphelenchoides bicaudatus]|nr:D-Importin 7/RanBP7 [Aphelenchoides bicaudatus]